MNKSVYHKRVTALKQNLSRMNADTVWIIQPENRRYLSGFKASDAQITESSGSLLISEVRSVLITDSRYTTAAKKEAVGFEIQTLGQDLIEEFPAIVNQMGTKILAFEEDYLTWGLHGRLVEKFKELSPLVNLVPISGLVEKMREVKDDLEIEVLATSAELIAAVLDEVISGLRTGITEKAVAKQIEDLALEAGAEDLAFPSIVASGPNSALPHAVPTNREIRPKEPIIIDVGVRLGGYCSDMTRTVFLGKPMPDFRKIYRTVRQAQLAALKEIRPGVDTDYPDSIARQVIRDAGFGKYFGHALGHGVGLATHERPRLGPRKPEKLKKGMVVTVEPGIYIPGRGGVRLEEMVVINKDGPRILTKAGNFYDFTS